MQDPPTKTSSGSSRDAFFASATISALPTVRSYSVSASFPLFGFRIATVEPTTGSGMPFNPLSFASRSSFAASSVCCFSSCAYFSSQPNVHRVTTFPTSFASPRLAFAHRYAASGTSVQKSLSYNIGFPGPTPSIRTRPPSTVCPGSTARTPEPGRQQHKPTMLRLFFNKVLI